MSIQNNSKYVLERYGNKIYLFIDGHIVLVIEDIGQNDQNIVDTYETVIKKVFGSSSNAFVI